ncbi:MAG: two-component sensor histidine kinase [Betaproteobacteria bacterium]|nr:two-component sensor histidine kinase [Betaproteobacteria bacterium]
MNSIRRRLIFWQIGALLMTGALASVITYTLAWDGFNRLRDYGLEQVAYSIVRHGVETENDEELADHGQFVSQIWYSNGDLAYSSLESVGPPPQKPGLNVLRWQGQEWHVYTLVEGGLTIQVGNPVANRARIFAGIFPWLLLPMSLLVALLGGFIWMSVGRALSPLAHVRAEIGRKEASSLTPLETHGLPDEVAPLVRTLNDLLASLDAALLAQRRFIADAAHELRTPLTGVRLQAQLARQAGSVEELEAPLSQLIQGVDRAGHLVEQLLQMARLEPEARKTNLEPVAMDELVRQTVAHLSAQADARNIDLGVGACVAATVHGHALSLGAMLTNLVDNALRYTPAGGRVDVEVQADAEDVLILVKDNGPGIPVSERAHVFDRFVRLAGAEIPGSGLGLSIVQRVADLHNGSITLDDTPGGGLTIRVRLPRVGGSASRPLSAS